MLTVFIMLKYKKKSKKTRENQDKNQKNKKIIKFCIENT